eukprot:CAMPEP_0181257922 /NCGR_PEP_ID=MMETSP1096-20121128/50504_1 /TAXON_ID=156174 ORGANISM="Chrysochromulina ericina, Strain CCMP281" /NCGR_SAMPLE_ID=MMETSP1096 /ASSEMBLY_ACC=CAM_ASM_000453 /LENGTH=32 /DNA_ID= /DNA_START= /DNA_END= /DNA_ORIENTATION=
MVQALLGNPIHPTYSPSYTLPKAASHIFGSHV